MRFVKPDEGRLLDVVELGDCGRCSSTCNGWLVFNSTACLGGWDKDGRTSAASFGVDGGGAECFLSAFDESARDADNRASKSARLRQRRSIEGSIFSNRNQHERPTSPW